ncbi:MAG: DUF933 domain-containing protein [Elusimicrobiota bacterium]
MRIGMLGLQGAGKKTLFRLMTGVSAGVIPPKGLPGRFDVRDPRVDELSRIYRPEKTSYARTDVLLLPDVEKTEGKAPWIEEVRNLDGLVCVARAFEDPSVFHPAGTVDVVRDMDAFMSELLFADMVLLEKRAKALSNEMRSRRTPEKEKELEVVRRLAKELDSGATMRTVSLSAVERGALQGYLFLTNKPVVAVVNVTQGADLSPVRDAVAGTYGDDVPAAFFDAKLECEIADMADPAERAEFLEELGIDEPAVAKLTRVIYDRLGLMSYFTVGADEVRAWTVRKGSTAPQAARVVHSDLERGFIRVEVMRYRDLVELGGDVKVRESGRAMLKGKDYIVEEGDILSFRAAP